MSMKDLALEIGGAQKFEAQKKYIRWVADEEGCSWEEAAAICEGRTDPIEHDYIIGYKLSIPVLQKAIASKRTRDRAIKAFEDSLPLEELVLFRKDYLPKIEDGSLWNSEVKKQRKNAKKS